MQMPDQSTIAEFRRRHQDLIGELFIDVLALCTGAGLVVLGEIALDGTKMRASVSYDRNRGYASIVEEILQEAEETDRAEDERYGEARGDEVPEALRTREGRRAALQAARERLQTEREARRDAGEEVVVRVELDLDPERFVTRPEGRRACGTRKSSDERRPRPPREPVVGNDAGSTHVLGAVGAPSPLTRLDLLEPLRRGGPTSEHRIARRGARPTLSLAPWPP